jgi:hypothetical protein
MLPSSKHYRQTTSTARSSPRHTAPRPCEGYQTTIPENGFGHGRLIRTLDATAAGRDARGPLGGTMTKDIIDASSPRGSEGVLPGGELSHFSSHCDTVSESNRRALFVARQHPIMRGMRKICWPLPYYQVHKVMLARILLGRQRASVV